MYLHQLTAPEIRTPEDSEATAPKGGRNAGSECKITILKSSRGEDHGNASSGQKMSQQSWTHSSQIHTLGPAMIRTSS